MNTHCTNVLATLDFPKEGVVLGSLMKRLTFRGMKGGREVEADGSLRFCAVQPVA